MKSGKAVLLLLGLPRVAEPQSAAMIVPMRKTLSMYLLLVMSHREGASASDGIMMSQCQHSDRP